MVYHNVVLEQFGPVTMDITDTRERGWASSQFINYGYAAAGGSSQHDADHFYQQLESMGDRYVSGDIVSSPGGQYDGQRVEQQPLETDPVTMLNYADRYGLAFGEGPYEPWF